MGVLSHRPQKFEILSRRRMIRRPSNHTSDLRLVFQKTLHPFDAKERSHLYKMNFLSVEELIENLTILLDITQSDEIGEDIHFPTEEEMYELLTKDNQDISILKEADRSFRQDEPVAVIWDTVDDQCYWCIGFYIQNITDEEIQVDHLTSKGQGNYEKWCNQMLTVSKLFTLSRCYHYK